MVPLYVLHFQEVGFERETSFQLKTYLSFSPLIILVNEFPSLRDLPKNLL